MSKAIVKLTGIGKDKFGKPVAYFALPGTSINVFKDLNLGEYEIDIEPVRKKRSISQNALLWSLIGEISKKESGNYADVDRIYSQILKNAAAKCTFLLVAEESLEDLKKSVRYVEIKEKEFYKGRSMYVVQCFLGSSEMNTEEMAKVIDAALTYAEKVNIDVDYWRNKLKAEEETPA